MNWFGYALSAVFIFSSYDILSRHLGKDSKSPQAFAVIFNFLASLGAFIFFLLIPSHFQARSWTIVLGIIGITIWGLFGRVEYEAHKRVQASTLTVFTRLAYIVTFILAILFLHESATFKKIVALFLILFASFLIAQKLKKKDLSGAIYALLLSSILGFGWFIDKFVSNEWGISFYILLSFLSPIISNLLLPPLSLTKIKEEVKNSTWLMLILPIIDVGGYYLMLKAFSLAEGSKVILVIAFTQILTILLGIIILNEKEHFYRKIIAGVLGVIALILLKS